jgi:pimeloyl-ACP methyl ester carboxylesterase
VKRLEFGAAPAKTSDRSQPHQRAQSIVFLHGGNVAGWMWGEQVPAFADFHVLVPDLPGFGASNDEPWTGMPAAADRVAELIHGRADGHAHVVGLSLGAGVGLHLALRHPEVVDSLFLSSTSVAAPSLATRVLGRAMLANWNRRWFWHALARGYGLPADSVDLFVDTGLGIRKATALALFDETVRGFTPEQLAAVPVATLAVAGERDAAAIARHSLADIRAHLPGALTATAPGMHHQWNIEDVGLFNRTLRTWLETRAVAEGLVVA